MGFPTPGNYFFIVPWVAFMPWYGMLITMLICWAAQGHPIYWFMDSAQFPVYISDIGATNLRPLFISCSAWQGLGYCICVACEYYQRSGRWPFLRKNRNTPKTAADDGYDSNEVSHSSIQSDYSEMLLSGAFLMPPWYTKHERNLIFAAFVWGLLGELALLFCTIFSTANYPHVHTAMVVVFVVCLFFSICCLTAEYFVMGRHYAVLHPLADKETTKTIDEMRWYQWSGHVWNKFTISGIVKTVWLVLAVVWAICFGALSGSKSSCFEWLLAFWFGVLFVIISTDFYVGGRYKKSLYFHQVQSFAGYYKYDELVGLPPHDNLAPEKVVSTDMDTNAITV